MSKTEGQEEPAVTTAAELAKSDAAQRVDPELIKWQHEVFRDVLSNVNETLRSQINLAVPLMAACVTILNIVPPQAHQELLNELDRWVFLPALVSIGLSYHGLQKHWYLDKRLSKLNENIEELYELVEYKDKMIHLSLAFQAIAVLLMMTFVLLEFK